MSLIEANGVPVQRMTLTLVSGRAWEADLALDTDTAPEIGSRLEIVGPGRTFAGSVVRTGADGAKQVTARVVGGAGMLGKMVEPRNYSGTTVGEVARHIVEAVGERLSGAVSGAVASIPMARWPRTRGDASTCLSELASDLDLVWRVLPDGTVWLGVDEGAEVEVEHDVTSEDPASGEVTVALEALALEPGQTFRGGPVVAVDYTLSGVRLAARVQRRGGSGLSRAADAAAAKATATTKLHPPTSARVVSQNADGTLELAVDSPHIGSISRVEIRHGLPGVTRLEMQPGARVALFFEGGDRKRCFAALFAGSSTTKVILDGERFELGGDAAVAMEPPLAAWADGVNAAITAIVAKLTTPGPLTGGPSGTPPGPLTGAGSATLFARTS